MTENEATEVLNFEASLTVAHRMDCACAPYFILRREALIPEVIKTAERKGVDSVDLFASFARSVHARHLSGLSLAVSA